MRVDKTAHRRTEAEPWGISELKGGQGLGMQGSRETIRGQGRPYREMPGIKPAGDRPESILLEH